MTAFCLFSDGWGEVWAVTAMVKNVTPMRLIIYKFFFYPSMKKIINGEMVWDV